MLYEVITTSLVFSFVGMETAEAPIVGLTVDMALTSDVVGRITSYNVCYTKLLRMI